MRLARLRAAMRRGWVWPMRPCTPRPRSRQILGSWVDLPEPVSPHSTTTWWPWISSAISCAALADRQLRRVLDGRHLGAAALHQGLGGADRLPEPDQPLIEGLPLPSTPPQTAQPRRQGLAVGGEAGVEVAAGWERSSDSMGRLRGHRLTVKFPRRPDSSRRDFPALVRRTARGGESGYVNVSFCQGQGA